MLNQFIELIVFQILFIGKWLLLLMPIGIIIYLEIIFLMDISGNKDLFKKNKE